MYATRGEIHKPTGHWIIRAFSINHPTSRLNLRNEFLRTPQSACITYQVTEEPSKGQRIRFDQLQLTAFSDAQKGKFVYMKSGDSGWIFKVVRILRRPAGDFYAEGHLKFLVDEDGFAQPTIRERDDSNYLWQLDCNWNRPELALNYPQHLSLLSCDERKVIQNCYLSKMGADNEDQTPSGSFLPKRFAVGFPLYWDKHVYYDVKLEDGMDVNEPYPHVLKIFGIITAQRCLEFKAGRTKPRFVMFCTGQIFELQQSGAVLTAIYDGVNGRIETLLGFEHLWYLTIDQPPRLVTSGNTEKLTKQEMTALAEFHSLFPNADETGLQIFASGPQLRLKAQMEDRPATNIFGPKKTWTGIFERRGKRYIQSKVNALLPKDQPANPLESCRYEIVDQGNRVCRLISASSGLFWRYMRFSTSWTYEVRAGVFSFRMFPGNDKILRGRYNDDDDIYEPEQLFDYASEDDDAFGEMDYIAPTTANAGKKRHRISTADTEDGLI